MRSTVGPVAIATVLSLLLAGRAAAGTGDPDSQPSPSPSPQSSTESSPEPTPTASPQPSTDPTASPAIATSSGWYGLNPADTITVFAPETPGRHPALIFIHGGAWGRSQPTSYELGWAYDVAQQEGWLVAVIGYPAKVQHEQVVEPYAIATAIHVIAHRGDVDSREVALWGESAGAQLALLAAYRNARTLHPLVSAVVSISGPTDMRTEYNSFAQIWLQAVTRFEGMTPQQARDAGSKRYPLTSPAVIVCRRDPPTFQAISRFDPLVPSNQVKVLTQRLISAGVAHSTVWLRGKDHSTTIESEYPPGSSYTVQQLAEAFISRVFAQRVASDR